MLNYHIEQQQKKNVLTKKQKHKIDISYKVNVCLRFCKAILLGSTIIMSNLNTCKDYAFFSWGIHSQILGLRWSNDSVP